MDIVIALVLLPFAVPLILASGLAVRLLDPGPVFFVQDRIGRNKRKFRCYQLRTMRPGTPVGASHLVGDAQVTHVGRMLRRTKLDELPQLLNVLRGEMSIVGPRPGLPIQAELIEARDARGVYSVRPGITGLAQIGGVDMSDPERLAKIDRQYIDRQSLMLDLDIMLKTLIGQGRGDAAIRK